MLTDTTDADLIIRVLEGDLGAYTSLVERHYASCARYARRMLGNAEDAEDALQETFLNAYRALGRYRERERFRSWLFSILVNQCRSQARSRSRRDRRFVSDDSADAANPAGDGAGEFRDALQVALDRLDPMLREALVLKYGEDLGYEEMARMTGCSVSALKMRVKRARDAVRPMLEAWFHE